MFSSLQIQIFYPKPQDSKVSVLAEQMASTEMGDFPEEHEMIIGTEQEAAEAGVDPSDIIYRCVHCDTLFPSKSDYTEHCCVINCELCGQKFKSSKALLTHKKTHTRDQIKAELSSIKSLGPTIFYCKLCNDTFNIDLQDVHKKIHQEGLKIFKCDQCEHVCLSIKDLVRHDKTSHRSQPKYVCTICNKKCASAANFRNHMCMHTGLKPFNCKYCEKTFNRSGDRNKHERVHTGEKPNVCEVCGKCFRVKSSLQLHMRTHTNERPYACNICSKAFKSFSSLSFHLKSHGQERPYKCPFCEKGFKTLNALHGHRNSHNKPFKCNTCDRSFAVRNAMLKHQSSMHQTQDKDKYDCVVCGASYGRAWSLEMHLKTHGKLGSENAAPDLLKKMVAMGSTVGNKSENVPHNFTENIEPVVKRPARSRKKKQPIDV